jgi:hypothetical protein
MRRRPAARESRLAHMAVGASMLAVPASAAAVGDPNASPTGLRVAKRHLDVAGAHTIRVWGALLPALPGHRVRLEGLIGSGWETLSTTRTGTLGRFILRFRPHSPGRKRLRVLTAGGSSGVLRRLAGTVTVYRQSIASWYYDGSQTACGFHARYGVANLSLPCGTRVSFMNGGRTVTAVVDDRGPRLGSAASGASGPRASAGFWRRPSGANPLRSGCRERVRCLTRQTIRAPHEASSGARRSDPLGGRCSTRARRSRGGRACADQRLAS